MAPKKSLRMIRSIDFEIDLICVENDCYHFVRCMHKYKDPAKWLEIKMLATRALKKNAKMIPYVYAFADKTLVRNVVKQNPWIIMIMPFTLPGMEGSSARLCPNSEWFIELFNLAIKTDSQITPCIIQRFENMQIPLTPSGERLIQDVLYSEETN